MKFDDILSAAANNPSEDPDEMGRFVDELIDADDLESDDRSAFCAGYMAGMAHALGIVAKTKDASNIIGEMMAKETGWHSRGYFS